MAVEIFGAIDRREDGRIRSFKPSWAEAHALEELQESIDSTKRQLKQGLIPPSEVPYAEARIERGEKRLKEINDSKPKLNAASKDWVSKERTRVADEIRQSMFTNTEMEAGFADPHEEAARMTEKKIPLDPEQAKACGITLVKGKGSRKDAEKMFQHLSYVLGESANVERLRKNGVRGSHVRGKKGAFDF